MPAMQSNTKKVNVHADLLGVIAEDTPRDGERQKDKEEDKFDEVDLLFAHPE